MQVGRLQRGTVLDVIVSFSKSRSLRSSLAVGSDCLVGSGDLRKGKSGPGFCKDSIRRPTSKARASASRHFNRRAVHRVFIEHKHFASKP